MTLVQISPFFLPLGLKLVKRKKRCFSIPSWTSAWYGQVGHMSTHTHVMLHLTWVPMSHSADPQNFHLSKIRMVHWPSWIGQMVQLLWQSTMYFLLSWYCWQNIYCVSDIYFSLYFSKVVHRSPWSALNNGFPILSLFTHLIGWSSSLGYWKLCIGS